MFRVFLSKKGFKTACSTCFVRCLETYDCKASGLVWFGLVRFGLVWFGWVRLGWVWFGWVRFGVIGCRFFPLVVSFKMFFYANVSGIRAACEQSGSGGLSYTKWYALSNPLPRVCGEQVKWSSAVKSLPKNMQPWPFSK